MDFCEIEQFFFILGKVKVEDVPMELDLVRLVNTNIQYSKKEIRKMSLVAYCFEEKWFCSRAEVTGTDIV